MLYLGAGFITSFVMNVMAFLLTPVPEAPFRVNFILLIGFVLSMFVLIIAGLLYSGFVILKGKQGSFLVWYIVNIISMFLGALVVYTASFVVIMRENLVLFLCAAGFAGMIVGTLQWAYIRMFIRSSYVWILVIDIFGNKAGCPETFALKSSIPRPDAVAP